MDRPDPENSLRARMLAFMGQCAQIVPVPIHRAEDLLALPREIRETILRDLVIEDTLEGLQHTENDL